ncbi:MAG: hypothetical protein K2Y22_04180 [Candidatus Obscuribacterales bacterium]|nr:hypothetical protein [Candidatus Obscuribacterales bacterium]
MTAGRRAYGSEFRLGDGGSNSTFTKIAKVSKFNAPGGKRTILDDSDHDSADGAMEFIAGMINFGKISGELTYINDATQQSLESVLDSGALQYFQIVIPTSPSKQFDFRGIVEELGDITLDADGKMVQPFTIQISGKVTRT